MGSESSWALGVRSNSFRSKEQRRASWKMPDLVRLKWRRAVSPIGWQLARPCQLPKAAFYRGQQRLRRWRQKLLCSEVDQQQSVAVFFSKESQDKRLGAQYRAIDSSWARPREYRVF